MKKKSILPILIVLCLPALACTISYEGIQFSDDPEPAQLLREDLNRAIMGEAASTKETNSASAATAEPQYQAVAPASSEAESIVAGSNEYSISSTNFDCICQETPDMTVDIKFEGNQMMIANQGSESPLVFDKVGDNTYQRTFTGYYILTSGTGDQQTETKVEEENRTVVILTGTGYVMENYKGENSSPCCYHTFTVHK
jgi:hypothetical protein